VFPEERRTTSGSSIPNLAALPLHGDARGIADLDPDAARTGQVGAIDLLRNDALGAKLTSVRDRADDQVAADCFDGPYLRPARDCIDGCNAEVNRNALGPGRDPECSHYYNLGPTTGAAADPGTGAGVVAEPNPRGTGPGPPDCRGSRAGACGTPDAGSPCGVREVGVLTSVTKMLPWSVFRTKL
jgi:hypothetical protein